MDKVLGVTIVVVLIVLAVTGMFLSWRRQRKQAQRFSITLPDVLSVAPIGERQTFFGLYVATTLATDPLVRVALTGLSFRAQTKISLYPNGILISPQGETETFLAEQQLVQLHSATTAIGKSVEKDGLTAISWQAFDTHIASIVELTSYFRLSKPEDHEQFENIFYTTYTSLQKGATS